MKKIVIYILMATVLLGCGKNKKKDNVDKLFGSKALVDVKYKDLNTQARQIFGALPLVAKDSNNAITKGKVKLGKMLYFEKRLSKDSKQSCNTCHNISTYGVDNNSFSKGNNGGLGARNSPTTFNAALHIAQFWDGRASNIESQVSGPVLNPVEMAMPSKKAVIKRLSKIKEYNNLFAKAFPNEKHPLSFKNLEKAIGTFERKLISPSRFDKYIAGDDYALTDKEKDGLQTFINSGCIACHTGTLVGGGMYQKFGLFKKYWKFTKSKKIDEGKFDVTKKNADKFVFKVPSLRNVEKTAPYFHDGSVDKLSEAVRIMAKIQINKDLSKEEINQIIDFLKTLTGKVPKELRENS